MYEGMQKELNHVQFSSVQNFVECRFAFRGVNGKYVSAGNWNSLCTSNLVNVITLETCIVDFDNI